MQNLLDYEAKAKDLNIGDLVIINTEDDYNDLALVVSVNPEQDSITVFDCFMKEKKCFNIADYKDFVKVDVKNLKNSKEYLDTLER